MFDSSDAWWFPLGTSKNCNKIVYVVDFAEKIVDKEVMDQDAFVYL